MGALHVLSACARFEAAAREIRAPDAIDLLPPGEERGGVGPVIAGLAAAAFVLTILAWPAWWVVH